MYNWCCFRFPARWDTPPHFGHRIAPICFSLCAVAMGFLIDYPSALPYGHRAHAHVRPSPCVFLRNAFLPFWMASFPSAPFSLFLPVLRFQSSLVFLSVFSLVPFSLIWPASLPYIYYHIRHVLVCPWELWGMYSSYYSPSAFSGLCFR